MKRTPILFLLLSLILSPAADAQPARPVIAHEPPTSVVAGQPLRIVARVNAEDALKEVQVYLAQTGGAAPVARPMQSAGAGVYVGRIEPEFFSAVEEFRYYITARTEAGAFTETNWSTVRVISGAGQQPQNERNWQRPVLIGAGAALAIGGGVALADSGSSSGGGDGAPPDDIDPADQVIIRTASGRVDESTPLLPELTVVDVADELAGRTITRVRVRVEFDAVDEGAEEFNVRYNNSVILAETTTLNVTRQVDVVGTASTQVEFRVISSEAVDGASSYAWNATFTFFVE
jgi:hypothetical protein